MLTLPTHVASSRAQWSARRFVSARVEQVLAYESPLTRNVSLLFFGDAVTVKPGDKVKRGDEFGYFKFGGSTIVLLYVPALSLFPFLLSPLLHIQPSNFFETSAFFRLLFLTASPSSASNKTPSVSTMTFSTTRARQSRRSSGLAWASAKRLAKSLAQLLDARQAHLSQNKCLSVCSPREPLACAALLAGCCPLPVLSFPTIIWCLLSGLLLHCNGIIIPQSTFSYWVQYERVRTTVCAPNLRSS